MNSTSDLPSDLVLAERHGAVLVLTLNRPDRLNAFSDELEAAYFAQLDAAEQDPTVRVVVVTGAGRAFCVGADLGDLADAEALARLAATARPRPRTRPLEVRKPLIAAINGPAAGLGLAEALYCDIRFCTPSAKLTTSFARLGLVAEYGVAWLLPRIVGDGRARDLLFSARVVSGAEALTMGLVDRVVEPERLLAETIAYATQLATLCSPAALADMKRQLRHAWEHTFTEASADADALLAQSILRADFAEGIEAQIARREPVFTALD